MDSMNQVNDVVIVGGGPAGSTAAAYLAMQNRRVTLLEKEKFPREHVGESLLPFCYHLLEELGVLEKISARFVRKPGVRFVENDGRSLTTWCFNHVIHDPSFLSFQVVRSEFDQILLENARSLGASVHEQTRVQEVQLDGPDNLVTVKATGPAGESQTHRARFLLDASGRDAFMANRNGWRQSFEGLDRTALWTHWKNVDLKGGLEEGLSLIVYLGGTKKGWIWVFPLSTDQLTVGVVLNNQYIREQKSALVDGGSADWKTDLYCQELFGSPFVNDLLQGGSISSSLKVEGNYSYYIKKENKYGGNYALIGDASTFIDPIFSSGIFLSMKGSRLVAEAVHTKLAGNGQVADPLAPAYKQINGAYELVHRLIQLFYNPHAISFAEAGALSQLEHFQHESAMAAGHYLLAGDFFERHQEYLRFMDTLQSASLFDKFKRTVIDRQEFQAISCDVDSLDIFPSMAAKAEEVSGG